MADTYRQVASVTPIGAAGDASQHITPVTMPRVGAGVARGLEEAGQGISRLGDYFGLVAADDAANQYQERVNAILYGDPQKTVIGPDGQPAPDTGFMGLRGRAALDARPDVDRRLEETRKEILGGLKTLQMSHTFEQASRRYKTYAEGRIGEHADRQAGVYYDGVFKSQERLAQNRIARDPENVVEVLQGREELRQARVRAAQTRGGGPDQIREAVESADRDAVIAQASAISVRDPARAMRIVESNKATLGTQYDEVAARFRSRANQQIGRETADDYLRGGGVVPTGTAATISEAILVQESGNNDRVRDSDAGAIGPGQIMPGTFAQWAKPGENIRNPADNRAVHKRMVDAYTQQYNGDVDRVAVAYFSGPGNVAPPGSPTPWKVNSSDGRKRVSEYVAEVRGRMRRPLAGESPIGEAPASDRPFEPIPQRDMINRVLSDPRLKDDPEAQGAAIARINQSYALERNQRAASRTAFDARVENATAEALNTGQPPTNPVPERDFIAQYGQEEGAVRYQQYSDNVKFGAMQHSFLTMPDNEIIKSVNDMTPAPGSPTYATQVKLQGRMREAANKIMNERREDPATAVDRLPSVQAARRLYDPKNPASFQGVMQARLAAQEIMGIDPEYRSPITKDEALKLTTPLARAIPGQEGEVAIEVAKTFRTMFGDQAPQALAYALLARKLTGLAQEQAGAVLSTLSEGRPLGDQEVRAFEEAKKAGEIEAALKTTKPTPPPRWFGDTWESMGFDMAPGQERPQAEPPIPRSQAPSGQLYPIPNTRALADLQSGALTPDRFDRMFGPGMAKKLQEKYPDFFRTAPAKK